MRVALALGGGGARGYAHAGVIDFLQERDVEVVSISGCSIGAVIGGLFAAGQLRAHVDWMRTVGRRDVLRLMDPTLRGAGVIRAERIMARVADLLGDVSIEQLSVPFAAVATDLLARRPVYLRSGSLSAAIRASIAMPPAIAPVAVQGRLLADGGVLDPLPIAAAVSPRAEAVVAVSLSGARHGQLPRSTGDPVRLDQGETLEQVLRGLRTRDVISLSLEAVQQQLTRYAIAACPPDVLIEIPADACGAYEFHRAAELIDVGRRAAREAFDRSRLDT